MVFKVGYLCLIKIEVEKGKSKWEVIFDVEKEECDYGELSYAYYPTTEQEKRAFYEASLSPNNKFILDISKNLKGEERIFNVYQNIQVER